MTQSIWCYPVLPLAEYVIWEGCGYLDDGYYQATLKQNGRGSVHPGADFNKRTGGNTDLGAPVRAMCTGRVIHARRHRVWGWVIVIDHPADGVQTQYAHFDKVLVKEGDPVRVGDQIGTIGRGGTNAEGKYYFLAHLHCEVRMVALPADEWPSNTMQKAAAEAYCQKTRHDPAKWLAQKGAAQTMQQLQQMLDRAAAAQAVNDMVKPTLPPPVPGTAGAEPNWVQVRDWSTKQPIRGDWVSVWKDKDGQLVLWRVEPYKLAQRGLQA